MRSGNAKTLLGGVGTRRALCLSAATFPHPSPQTGRETLASSGFPLHAFARSAVATAVHMAPFAQCYQIVGRVLAASVPWDDVVDVEIVSASTISATVA